MLIFYNSVGVQITSIKVASELPCDVLCKKLAELLSFFFSLLFCMQKLDKRLKAVTEEERDGDLFSALHVSLVSSDESDTEDNSLRTRPLSWRTKNVNNFFKLLDGRAKAAMTSQQRRQSVSRRRGVDSERGTDTVPEHLKWAVCNSP